MATIRIADGGSRRRALRVHPWATTCSSRASPITNVTRDPAWMALLALAQQEEVGPTQLQLLLRWNAAAT